MKLIANIFVWINIIFRRLSEVNNNHVIPVITILSLVRNALAHDVVENFVLSTKSDWDDKLHKRIICALSKAIKSLEVIATNTKDHEKIFQAFIEYLKTQPAAIQEAVLSKLASITVHASLSDQGYEIKQNTADTITQLAYTHLKEQPNN